jgi:high potential iron-sulfur protein
MSRKISRRRVLQACGMIVPMAMAMAGPFLLKGRPAHAQQEATKQQVQYQDTPKKGQDCEKCLQFTPPDGCKLVGGKINPKGWCLLFAQKPK